MAHFPSFPRSKDSQQIVYVRAVAVADLPDEVKSQVPDRDALYAIHDENGAQLALVADRQHAFHVARNNEMAPFSVH